MRAVSEPRLRNPIWITEIVIADDGAAWRSAGFTVDDTSHAQIGTVRFHFVGRAAPSKGGIVAWSVDGISPADDLDGLATTVVDDASRAVPRGNRYTDVAHAARVHTHQNSVTIVDHVVVATPDVDRTIGQFVSVGMEPRRERVGGTEAHPMRQVFLRAGEVIIEVVGPPAAPNDARIRARPAAFFGLAFSCADLDECAAQLGDGVGTIRDATQPGRRIATLRHHQYGISVPTVLMTE